MFSWTRFCWLFPTPPIIQSIVSSWLTSPTQCIQRQLDGYFTVSSCSDWVPTWTLWLSVGCPPNSRQRWTSGRRSWWRSRHGTWTTCSASNAANGTAPIASPRRCARLASSTDPNPAPRSVSARVTWSKSVSAGTSTSKIGNRGRSSSIRICRPHGWRQWLKSWTDTPRTPWFRTAAMSGWRSSKGVTRPRPRCPSNCHRRRASLLTRDIFANFLWRCRRFAYWILERWTIKSIVVYDTIFGWVLDRII